MRTTKDDVRRIRKLVDDTATHFGGGNVYIKGETLLALCDDADRARMADDALTTIALAAGLGADASAEKITVRVGEMARTLSLIGTWRHEHGAALKPSRADTYGDGMRDAKQQVGAILSRLAESGRG